ncbi:MAG: HEAT repeat domain-containing protein [Deferribacterales bacterium]
MEKSELLKALQNDDEAERIYAVEDVIDLKDKSLYPVIIDHMEKEESRLVRELIVEGLKVMDVSDSYDAISKYFESTDAYVRNCAIEIFGAKGEDAVAFLTSIMDNEDKEVRKLILDSLVATSSKYSIPALRAALNDKAANVMITAIEYLGKIYDEESLRDVLDIFIRADEPMVRSACLETLTLMGNSDIVDTVLNTLGQTGVEGFYKPSVIRLVGEKGGKRHLEFLLSFLNNKNTMYFREVSNGILKIVSRENIEQLDEIHTKFMLNNLKNLNGYAEERLTFLYIIAKLNIPDKETLYEELASDDNEDLSLTAIEHLADIDKDRAVRLIENKLKLAEGEHSRNLSALLDSIKE